MKVIKTKQIQKEDILNLMEEKGCTKYEQ